MTLMDFLLPLEVYSSFLYIKLHSHRFRRVVGGQPNAQEYDQKQRQLEALKQLEDQGELELYYLDEAGECLIPCIPYG